MDNFFKDIKNQVIKVINYEKKEMIPLTNNEKKFVIYVKKTFA